MPKDNNLTEQYNNLANEYGKLYSKYMNILEDAYGKSKRYYETVIHNLTEQNNYLTNENNRLNKELNDLRNTYEGSAANMAEEATGNES